MTQVADTMAAPKNSEWRSILIVIAVATLLFYTHLDSPLLEPEETRYAEIPRQMFVEGSWLVPAVHGQPYYDKPPLLYWLVMGSYQVLGIHDWSARFIAASAAVLCILVTYFFAKSIVGTRGGLFAALILALSARFIHLGRMVTMNSLLSLFIVMALAAAYLAVRTPFFRMRYWLAAAALCGLGVMTKGPVAIVLVFVPAFVWSRLDPGAARIGFFHSAVFALITSIIAVPWFVAMAWNDPRFVEYFFWTHHILRYVAPLDHEQPLGYYLPNLILGMFPWTILLPGLLWRFWLRLRRRESLEIGDFFLLCALWCLLFLSLAGSKRNGYILPAFPPLAIALGCYLDSILVSDSGRRTLAWKAAFATTFAVLFGSVLLLLPAYARRYSLRDHVEAISAATAEISLPVICYPHRWDSVHFYLQRQNVGVFRSDDLGILMKSLLHHPQTLLFIKNDDSYGSFLKTLPRNCVFEKHFQHGSVIAGIVRTTTP